MDELIDLLEKVKLLCTHSQTIVKRREIDCRSQKGWNDQEIIFLGNEHCERERERKGKNAQPLCMNCLKSNYSHLQDVASVLVKWPLNQTRAVLSFGIHLIWSLALNVAFTFRQRRWPWCHHFTCQESVKVSLETTGSRGTLCPLAQAFDCGYRSSSIDGHLQSTLYYPAGVTKKTSNTPTPSHSTNKDI